MKKIAVVVLLVAVLVLAVPAAASPPMGVRIEIPLPGPPGVGTFVATGPAVESGVICEEGETQDLFNKVRFVKGGRGINVFLRREYSCDDGSGSFIMNLNAKILFFPREVSGRWNILSGTGAYEKLHGSGAVTDSILVNPDPLSVIDILDGRMHTD